MLSAAALFTDEDKTTNKTQTCRTLKLFCPLCFLLAVFPLFLLLWLFVGQNIARITGAEQRHGMCVWWTHALAVMRQALCCGCRPDSLIREECCPWHPEFSTEITHSSSLFPALWVFLSAWTDQKREPSVSLSLPLYPPLALPIVVRPSLHHMLFHTSFITFSFSLHHLGSVNVGYWRSLFLSKREDESSAGPGVTLGHDSQSESDQFSLIAEEMVVD